MANLAKALRTVTAKGKFGDDRLALINPGEDRMLHQAGGVGTPVPGTDGLVKQFYSEHEVTGASNSSGKIGSMAAGAGAGGSGKTNGSSGAARTVDTGALSNVGAGGGQTAANVQADDSRTFASNDPNRLSPNLNNPHTQNVMRSETNFGGPGATPYISDPSFGQILGAIFSTAPFLGSLNNLGGAAYDALSGDNPSGVYNGGAIGNVFDSMRGVTPGAVTGSTSPDVNASTRATPGSRTFNSLKQARQGTIFSDPVLNALVNPKTYSSNDATIIR